jgi:hypothetical protein
VKNVAKIWLDYLVARQFSSKVLVGVKIRKGIMKPWEKLVFGLNLVLTATVFYLMIIWFNNSVENCWDRYDTEKQAIEHCEKHDA